MLAWDVDGTCCWLLVTAVFFVSFALLAVLLQFLSPTGVDADGEDCEVAAEGLTVTSG